MKKEKKEDKKVKEDPKIKKTASTTTSVVPKEDKDSKSAPVPFDKVLLKVIPKLISSSNAKSRLMDLLTLPIVSSVLDLLVLS